MRLSFDKRIILIYNLDMNRIECIARHCAGFNVIADVGCDHGYTIKYAFDNCGIKKAYAIDNKIGPLNKAIENLKDYNEIVFSLSDGLTEVGEDTEVLIISGMGGDLIRDILEKHFEKLSNIKKIVVEANSKDKVVRQFLLEKDYVINTEEIIEDDLIYVIDTFVKGKNDYTDKEIKYGPALYNEKPELFIKYWTEKINDLEKINNEYTLRKAKQIKEDLGL